MTKSCHLIRKVNVRISLHDNEIEQVSSYKYLGNEIRVSRSNQTDYLQKKIEITWTAFGNLK